MIFNMTGGGGAGLNFKIVGITSQPTNPTENMIWVNTDTTINGYFFGSTEPENPTDGMMWFVTGSSSPAAFNVLKKNGLMVYLLSANQYGSGEWKRVPANVWQNNEWKDLVTDTVFYESGAFNTKVFGEPTGNINNNGRVLRFTNGNNVNATKPFSVDGFSSIEMVIDSTYWVSIYVELVDESGTAVKSQLVTTGTNGFTSIIDISDVTGSYYLRVRCTAGNASSDYANVSRIKFLV